MSQGFGLFEGVVNDPLKFGLGSSFQPKRVTDTLGLKREDVSRLASVSVKSVRYDDAMPEQMRERLEEIAQTINLVAQMFDGDVEKTVAWFKARNPMLGDVSPREMIRLGRYERLRKFIVNAMLERRSDQLSEDSYVELGRAAPAGVCHTRLDQSSGDQLAGRDVLLGSAGPRR